MNRARSIRARLVAVCVVTLSLIYLCFGGYIFWSFKGYLVQSLQQALSRRAYQIAATIIADVPQRGEVYVASEIQARYAPELNERMIRVTAADGRLIYASRNAGGLADVPVVSYPRDRPDGAPAYREIGSRGEGAQVVALGYRLPAGGAYVVEVGAPEADITSALDGLLVTLLLGFPVFIGLTSVGAYVLLGRALRPVDEIVRSAELITLRNLSQRLPVAKTGDEVERLSLSLNRMIQRLDESYQVTSRFSADASHELRTPLTIMRGELEALLSGESLGEEQAAQIESILEEAERLTLIVEGLLAISRLEAGESQINKDPVDLSHLVASTVEQMGPMAEEKLLTMDCAAGEGVMVEANGVRLKQVVVNLLDNAIKYTPEGGRIEVKVTTTALNAEVEVRDNGIGVSAEALPHIFKRFYRAEKAQSGRVRGTGLGLSMVHSIMEAHGGEVTVESRENAGSTFRFRLPKLDLRMARKAGPGENAAGR